MMFGNDLNIEATYVEAVAATQKYFSQEEWTSFSTIRKEHLISQMRNYLVMQKIGLNPGLPDYVQEHEKREARKKAANLRKLKAQEEGVVKPKKKKRVPMETRIVKGKFGYSYAKVKKKLIEGQYIKSSDSEEEKEQQQCVASSSRSASSSRGPNVKCVELNQMQGEAHGQDKENAEPRYPRRNVPRRNYKEDPEPDDDDYFFCDHCHTHVLGMCVDHGKPLRVLNNPAPAYCENRALRTLPDGLSVRQSKIPGAGMGVFADVPIPPFVQLGPYEGPLFTHSNNDGYCWQIRRTGQNSLSVDAKDINKSSWLRYVDCACHDSQQNLSPYQHKGMIFYMTRCWIYPGDELLTWYGKEFMQDLGIDMKAYFEPLPEPKPPPPPQRRSIQVRSRGPSSALKCLWCPMGFSAQTFVQRHVHYKHGSEHSLLVLQHKATVMFPPSHTATAIGALFVQEEITASLMNLPCNSGVTDNDKAVARRVLTKRQGGVNCLCNICGETFTHKQYLNQHMKIHDEDNILNCADCSFKTVSKINLERHVVMHLEGRDCHCDVCNRKFTQESHYDTHVKSVHGKLRGNTGKGKNERPSAHGNKKRPYQCEQCTSSFTQRGHLTTHMRVHSRERPYQCTQCEYSCTQSGDLTYHMRVHSKERPYQCTQCEYSCTQSGSLTTHMRVHSKEKPYQCTQCEYSCTQSGSLTTHMRVHSKERPYQCTQCEYSCTTSGSLTTHMRVHSKEKPYQCTQCEYSCTQRGNLTTHMRVHSKEKPYQCTQCEYSCTTSSYLTYHMRVHSKEKPYQCTQCEYSCTQSGHLTTHMRVHSKERPYQCTQCEYSCAQSGHLTTHMRVHSKERPYQCTQCEYSCAQSSSLTRHMRVHSKEKPYQCTQCEYSCTTSGSLTTHMRVHSKERPYQCTQCEYSCTTSGSLTTHMRVHSKERPYQCTQCEYSCARSSYLTTHMRMHTGEKPYQCTQCDDKFVTSSRLKSHVKQRH